MIAPDDVTPVPATVNGSAELTNPEPAISNAAPEATVVAPALEPRALDVVIASVPASTDVAPE